MLRYILRRLLLSIPVLWGVSLIVFVAIRLVPGDVLLAKMQGEFSTKPEQIAQMRAELGLDVPAPLQYLYWLRGLLHGDLGISISTRRPVTADLQQYFPATVELAVAAIIFAEPSVIAPRSGVSVSPGATQLTLTPWRATSRARPLVKAITPPLAPE